MSSSQNSSLSLKRQGEKSPTAILKTGMKTRGAKLPVTDLPTFL